LNAVLEIFWEKYYLLKANLLSKGLNHILVVLKSKVLNFSDFWFI